MSKDDRFLRLEPSYEYELDGMLIVDEDLEEKKLHALIQRRIKEQKRERRVGSWKTRHIGRLYPGLEIRH